MVDSTGLPSFTTALRQGPTWHGCSISVQLCKCTNSTDAHALLCACLAARAWVLWHVQGYIQYRIAGEPQRLDVDTLNEQLRLRGAARMRLLMRPDEAYGMIFDFDGLLHTLGTVSLHSVLFSMHGSVLTANSAVLSMLASSCMHRRHCRCEAREAASLGAGGGGGGAPAAHQQRRLRLRQDPRHAAGARRHRGPAPGLEERDIIVHGCSCRKETA